MDELRHMDRINSLMGDLKLAVRDEIEGEGGDLLDENKELQGQVYDLTTQLEHAQRRLKGMSSTLARIRIKCDIGTGLDRNVPYDDQGRSCGAEGAVDRLLAVALGKTIRRNLQGVHEEVKLYDRVVELEKEIVSTEALGGTEDE